MTGSVALSGESQRTLDAAPVNARYPEGLAEFAAETISKGSKSFALASRLFGPDMRTDAQLLYAWCRHCDDVIDGQDLGGDAPDISMSSTERLSRLNELFDKTDAAISGNPPPERAFSGLAAVATSRGLPAEYVFAHLEGFRHDVNGEALETIDDVLHYSYGVAGVVGIMMAIVMGIDPSDDNTLDCACDLGLAFQLTNICRDVMDDAHGGRVYLPSAWLDEAGIDPTGAGVMGANPGDVFQVIQRVLAEADRYYHSASAGIPCLGPRAGAAVAAARNVYRDIGLVIKQAGPDGMATRAIVSKPRKLLLATAGAFSGVIAAGFGRMASDRAMSQAPRPDLWERPREAFGPTRASMLAAPTVGY
ncbi:MAG: phytoene/squalene synthase family protein [Pseudomonadota bacterium]